MLVLLSSVSLPLINVTVGKCIGLFSVFFYVLLVVVGCFCCLLFIFVFFVGGLSSW